VGTTRQSRPNQKRAKPLTIGFISLGCPKNLIDTETMIGQSIHQFKLVNNPEDASILVINSCAFTNEATKETRDTIEEFRTWKQKNKTLILTGCYVEEKKEAIFKEYPFIDGILNTGAVAKLPQLIRNIFDNKNKQIALFEDRTQNFDQNINRTLATKPHTAYLKISDGCDQHCSFCIIPSLRGPYFEKSIGTILSEAKQLVSQGVREVILVGQDLLQYGVQDNLNASNLLEKLCQINDLEWVRLMYCYPEKITTSLIETINNEKKIVNYIDMPIQHVSDNILGRMNRKSSNQLLRDKIGQLRKAIPTVKLRSTVIVGFPGETDEHFSELLSFVKEIKFDHLGVFKYSKVDNTPAAKMSNQVSEIEKEKRYNRLMQIQQRVSYDQNQSYINQTLEVLIDDKSEGRRYFDAPDIDGTVLISNIQPKHIGSIQQVIIKKADAYDLVGEII
jgi:ribosomal protein S12 methylthiotransferase